MGATGVRVVGRTVFAVVVGAEAVPVQLAKARPIMDTRTAERFTAGTYRSPGTSGREALAGGSRIKDKTALTSCVTFVSRWAGRAI